MSFSSNIPLQSNQLPISINLPTPDHPDFSDILSLTIKRISDSMNKKEGSLFPLEETANFNQYFKYSDPVNFIADVVNFRGGYRVTFDLIALNAGVAIGAGVTTLTLTATTQPPLINQILYPTRAYGGATIAGPIYIFVNDPELYIRFDNTVPTAQTIIITNNTGSNVTQLYWVMEYLKD